MSHNNDPMQFAKSKIREIFTSDLYPNKEERAFGYISALRDFDVITPMQWWELVDLINFLALQQEVKG